MQCGAHRCVEKCADKTAADSADGVVCGLVGCTGEYSLAGLNTHKFELHQLLDRRRWKPVVHDCLHELPAVHRRGDGRRWCRITPGDNPRLLGTPAFPHAAARCEGHGAPLLPRMTIAHLVVMASPRPT